MEPPGALCVSRFFLLFGVSLHFFVLNAESSLMFETIFSATNKFVTKPLSELPILLISYQLHFVDIGC